MPRPRPILGLVSLIAAAALAAGCGGGGDEPKPSIPLSNAQTLVGTLQEIQANVDEGSCLIAADKVQEFEDEVAALPSDVNNEVVDALNRGAQNLLGLIEEDCGSDEETTTEETTTEETTTEETTTEETTTETQPTTTTQPTTPTPPPDGGGGGGSGGVGPGNGGL